MRFQLDFCAVTCLVVVIVFADNSPIYVDNGLGQTVIGEDISPQEKAEMQADLLRLLGLHRRPRPASAEVTRSAPKFLMDIYNSMVDDERGELKLDPGGAADAWRDFNITFSDVEVIDNSDMIMSFVNQGSHTFNQVTYNRRQLVWFDLTEVPLDDNQLISSLRVYQGYLEAGAYNFREYTLRIHQLMRGENHTVHLRELDRRILEPGYVGWLTFNVSRAADLWRVFPEYNLGLYMEVTDEDGKPVVLSDVGVVDAFDDDSKQPFMTAYFKHRRPPHFSQTRFKRSGRWRRRKNKGRSRQESYNPLKSLDRPEHIICQRQNLFVCFRNLGWQDWIIAPEGYPAFFCKGLCAFPLNSQMNATNHAIVQTLTHLLDPYNYPEPSCAPNKLSSISVLYFDDNSNVILKKYPDMVATSCGCH